MRRVVVLLLDRLEIAEELLLARDRKRDGEKLGALDLVAKLRALVERAVVVVYIALRSRMGCAIASSAIRSITSG